MNLTNASLNDLEIGKLFLSIFLLLISGHIFGTIFSRYSLPRVVGEIFGGILLGPSFFGSLFPHCFQGIFCAFPEQGKILSFLYWLGLIFLMLSTGFSVNRESTSADKRIVSNLVVSSTLLPIFCGIIFFKLYDFSSYIGNSGTQFSLACIICISVAITSVPVISKIFIDLNIIKSSFAKIVLTSAIMHDFILWIGVDFATKDYNTSFNKIMLSEFINFLFLAIFFIYKDKLNKLNMKTADKINETSIVSILMIIILSIIVIANFIGINIIFGTLILGIIVGGFSNTIFEYGREIVSKFSLGFFVPIYFVIVGVKINLPMNFNLQLFLTFLFVSSTIEIASVYFGLRKKINNKLTRINFGLAMNARGGPGIVVASIGYEFQIINETLFVALILVAITTSFISGAWFKFVLDKKWELYKNHPNLNES